MPLYEYKCRKCHHRFEELQKLSDPPIRTCPKCKARGVEKLISAPAVQFKGTGWYVTDYAGKSSTDQRASDEKREKGEPADKTEKPGKAEKPDKGGKGPKADSGKKRSSKD